MFAHIAPTSSYIIRSIRKMKFNPEIARDILLDIEELHQYPESFIFSAPEKFNRAKKYDIDIFPIIAISLLKQAILSVNHNMRVMCYI